MPQFDFANPIVWAQLAWLGLAFVILYFGIVRMTIPKLAKTMDAREGQVSTDIANAERAKKEADALAESYTSGIDEAHKLARTAIVEAKARAAASVERATAASNAVIAEKAAAADAALASARSRALGEIQNVAADAAADMIERLTGKRPDLRLIADVATKAMAAS
jgi:F-type H+-transporting ATPase subunit b